MRDGERARAPTIVIAGGQGSRHLRLSLSRALQRRGWDVWCVPLAQNLVVPKLDCSGS